MAEQDCFKDYVSWAEHTVQHDHLKAVEAENRELRELLVTAHTVAKISQGDMVALKKLLQEQWFYGFVFGVCSVICAVSAVVILGRGVIWR